MSNSAQTSSALEMALPKAAVVGKVATSSSEEELDMCFFCNNVAIDQTEVVFIGKPVDVCNRCYGRVRSDKYWLIKEKLERDCWTVDEMNALTRGQKRFRTAEEYGEVAYVNRLRRVEKQTETDVAARAVMISNLERKIKENEEQLRIQAQRISELDEALPKPEPTKQTEEEKPEKKTGIADKLAVVAEVVMPVAKLYNWVTDKISKNQTAAVLSAGSTAAIGAFAFSYWRLHKKGVREGYGNFALKMTKRTLVILGTFGMLAGIAEGVEDLMKTSQVMTQMDRAINSVKNAFRKDKPKAGDLLGEAVTDVMEAVNDADEDEIGILERILSAKSKVTEWFGRLLKSILDSAWTKPILGAIIGGCVGASLAYLYHLYHSEIDQMKDKALDKLRGVGRRILGDGESADESVVEEEEIEPISREHTEQPEKSGANNNLKKRQDDDYTSLVSSNASDIANMADLDDRYADEEDKIRAKVYGGDGLDAAKLPPPIPPKPKYTKLPIKEDAKEPEAKGVTPVGKIAQCSVCKKKGHYAKDHDRLSKKQLKEVTFADEQQEAAVPGSELVVPERVTQRVFRISTDDGRVGTAFRIANKEFKNPIVTATHNIAKAKKITLEAEVGGKRVAIELGAPVREREDIVMFSCPPQLSALKCCYVMTQEMWKDNLQLPAHVWTAGFPKGDHKAHISNGRFTGEQQGDLFVHYAATEPGVSGGPIMLGSEHGYRVLGVHYGNRAGKNVFTAFTSVDVDPKA